MGSLLTTAITVGLTIAFFVALIAFIPPYSLPAASIAAMTNVIAYIQGFSFVIAIDQLIQVVLAIVIVEGVLWVLKVVMWLYKRISKSGSN